MQPSTGPRLSRPLRLKDFDFGYASADAEVSDRPELLERGFLDHAGMIDTALNSRKFLFLGYKGSGKSALGEHLVLIAEKDYSLFVRMLNISDLSFQSFSHISQAVMEPEARYPTSWSWLFLLQFFDSFARDLSSNIETDPEMANALDVLKKAGLLPDPDLGKTVKKSLDVNLSIKFPGFELAGKGGAKEVADIPFFVEHLKRLAASFRTQNKHIIIVDGFDDLLRRRNLQFDALGALIFEANRLNALFSRHRIPAKLILLCRTDLFERLPGPNNNKIRQDFAISLDWYHDGRPEESPLVRLINLRASLKWGQEINVFRNFLPIALQADKPPHATTNMIVRSGGSTMQQLLDHTRHVPRDMIMLFKKLQELSGDDPMSPGQVFDAMVAFSKSYFVQEIKDELDGQVSTDEIARAFRLFSTVRKRVVRYRELEDRAKKLKYPVSFALDHILPLLFDCSAIGNIDAPVGSGAGSTFKFRNRFASFDESRLIVFHRALWECLDLH